MRSLLVAVLVLLIPISYGDQESKSGEELIKNWEKSKEMRRAIQERMKDRGSHPCGYMGCNDFGVGTKVDTESSDVKERREKDIERQKEVDDFNELMYKSPTIKCGSPSYGVMGGDLTKGAAMWDRVGGSSSESPDIKEKQEIEAVYVGGRGILEMMIKDPDEVRALVLQQNTKSSNIKEEQEEDVLVKFKADLKEIKKKAEEGDAGAQYLIGAMYSTDEIVSQNLTEAFKWFKLSADQGYQKAIYRVWRMYQEGNGVSKDPVEAKNWLSKCCGCEEGVMRHCF